MCDIWRNILIYTCFFLFVMKHAWHDILINNHLCLNEAESQFFHEYWYTSST